MEKIIKEKNLLLAENVKLERELKIAKRIIQRNWDEWELEDSNLTKDEPSGLYYTEFDYRPSTKVVYEDELSYLRKVVKEKIGKG